MMRGSELDTTVLDRIATSMPSIRPDIASSTSRCVMAPAGWSLDGVVAGATWDGVVLMGRALRGSDT
ncbi:hypothetical protein GCM10028814_26890 [Angustibacter aerolatus]